MVEWIETDDGWLARCPQYAAWRPAVMPERDRERAEKLLKAHQTRHVQFTHMAWSRLKEVAL
jgi:hypothetical protein